MQEKSIIKQNILKYLDFKGISPYKFYQDSGITRGVLGQNNGMSEENTAKFLAYCSDVNIDWLLTGRGSMLKSLFEDIHKTEDQRKRDLFNSFGDISSGDERLQAMVSSLQKKNEILEKENRLQSKIIEGLERENQLLREAKEGRPSFLHDNVAEPAPELISKKHK